MKKSFLFLLLVIMLSGCVRNTNNVEVSENEQQSIEDSFSEAQATSASFESTTSDKTTMAPNFENVSIEYYIDNTVKPELKTSEGYPAAEIEKIASMCLKYYGERAEHLDDNGIPKGLSNIRTINIFAYGEW